MATEVKAEMAGNIWKIEVREGAQIVAGDVILIMESMKMEIPVEAPKAGVCRLRVSTEQAVQEGEVLAVIE